MLKYFKALDVNSGLKCKCDLIMNKKVLLRERKRHTARRVVRYSFCCPTRVPPRGGTRTWVPPQGGYLDLGTPPGGVPGPGYPPGGYPETPRGVPRPGYPPLSHGILGNVAKHYGIWVPPPVDRQIDGWTDTCQNITFPRTTYAGGKNSGSPTLGSALAVPVRKG